jgi:hypothetical protein
LPKFIWGITAMLSYILGMALRFEREYGFPPNLLCLNQNHMRCLGVELGGVSAPILSERLGLAVMMYPGIGRPLLVHLFQARNAAIGRKDYLFQSLQTRPRPWYQRGSRLLPAHLNENKLL